MEHVILIHGTFAGSDKDHGLKWWQKGSDFSIALEERLPEGISCMSLDRSFHWSGANSNSERRQGALGLIQYISGLEERNEPYHFVAHSHGGGVAWDALVVSELLLLHSKARRKFSNPKPIMRNLKSITTIGTPFLAWHDSPGFFKYLGFFSLIVGFLLLPMFLVFKYVNWSYQYGAISHFWFLMLVLAAISLMSVAIQPISYFSTFIQLLKESFSAVRVAERFAKRCFFIFAESDEAIQGLQGGLRSKARVMPKKKTRYISPFDETFIIENRWNTPLEAIKGILSVPYKCIYNYIFVPIGNRIIWRALQNNAFGADRDGASIGSVQRIPSEIPYSVEPLPECIEKTLMQISQDGINAILPHVRKILGQFSSEKLGPKSLNFDDTQRACLVHNAYFESTEVTDIIAAHIQYASYASIPDALSNGGSLKDYFEAQVSARDQAIYEIASEKQLRSRINVEFWRYSLTTIVLSILCLAWVLWQK